MDYSNCAIPKPGGKKPDKRCNGYKDKPNRHCYYTGAPGAERHEIFHGTGKRQISIDNGFQIDVHPAIHAALQQNATEWAVKENQKWEKYFQKEYEKKLRKKRHEQRKRSSTLDGLNRRKLFIGGSHEVYMSRKGKLPTGQNNMLLHLCRLWHLQHRR